MSKRKDSKTASMEHQGPGAHLSIPPLRLISLIVPLPLSIMLLLAKISVHFTCHLPSLLIHLLTHLPTHSSLIVLMESPQTHASKRSRGLGPYDEENHAPQPTYMSAARTKRGLCDDGQLFDKRTRHSDSMTTNICGDTTLDRNSALIDNNMFISSLNREYQQQLTKKSYELQGTILS